MPAVNLAQGLLAGQPRLDLQQTKPLGRGAGGTLDALRIGNAPSQHLIAAADAEHAAAAAQVRHEIDVPALPAQEIEIGTGRFRPRQDDQVRIARNGPARRQHGDPRPRFLHQRIEIVEIGDPRELETDHMQPVAAARAGALRGDAVPVRRPPASLATLGGCRARKRVVRSGRTLPLAASAAAVNGRTRSERRKNNKTQDMCYHPRQLLETSSR